MMRVRESGFALVSALIIVALVTSITVAMAVNQSRQIDQTSDIVINTQLKHHGEAIFHWATGLLIEDSYRNATDSASDVWNQSLASVPIEQGEINAVLEDLQGRFNINNLGLSGVEGTLARQRFQRLLQVVNVQTDITDAVADWIDSDTQMRFPLGAEDDYYLALERPYRTGNQAMVSTSELLLVKGVTREIYYALLPFIAALPAGTSININTARTEVLLSLSDFMDTSATDLIQSMSSVSPFTEIGTGGVTAEEGTTDASGAVVDANGNTTTSVSDSSSDNTDTSSFTGRFKNIDIKTLETQSQWSAINERNKNILQQMANADRADVVKGTTSASSGSVDLGITAGVGGQSTVSRIDPTGIPEDEVIEQPLSSTGILDQYQINTQGLGVSSQFFSITGKTKQYGNTVNVQFLLFRNATENSISSLARVYNGQIYD